MPYTSTSDLPDIVRNVLPSHAQEISMEAFNSAWRPYHRPEERRRTARGKTAHRVAWAAVKNKYEKDDETGRWKEK